MRVLALIDGLGWGGAETLLAEFAAGAPSAGLDLRVAFLLDKDGSPSARRLRARGVEPVHVPITGLVKPSAVAAVRRHVAAVAPDVVHCHLGYSDVLGGIAARTLRIPCVSTLHLMAWDRDTLRDRVKLGLMGGVQRRLMHRTICVSAAARDAYLAQGWNVPGKVVVVHNGIEGHPAPAGAGAAVRAELGIRPGEQVVTMVSVLRPGKGHAEAFAAIAALRAAGLGVRLVVAGTGPLAEDLRAAAPEGVVLAGHRDDVMALLDATDVLLHPSHFDAFPTALLEAAAARVPVVATRVGGIPEIVEDGETGSLVDSPPRADAIAAALRSVLTAPVERRAAMGAAARARFDERFQAEAWARAVRGVYETAQNWDKRPFSSDTRPAPRDRAPSRLKRPQGRADPPN